MIKRNYYKNYCHYGVSLLTFDLYYISSELQCITTLFCSFLGVYVWLLRDH